jgi:hypothetical protein
VIHHLKIDVWLIARLETSLVYDMSIKRLLTYGMFGLMVFLVSCVILSYAWAYTEKREVLLTTSSTIGGQEQRFKAFHLPAPAKGLEVTFNVSKGSIKFSEYPAPEFEEPLGYFEYYTNGTVEKRQLWYHEGNNGTVGVVAEDPLWYLVFYNEDSYEKEVHMQIIKFWREQNYQSWVSD